LTLRQGQSRLTSTRITLRQGQSRLTSTRITLNGQLAAGDGKQRAMRARLEWRI